MRFVVALVATLLLALPAQAERLVSMVSREIVAITSSFAGETLTLFGNIEPDVGAAQKFVEGPYNIIITVTGPLQDRVVRRSEPVLGIWMNTEQTVFEDYPSYYHVLASAPLDDIAGQAELDRLRISPQMQALLAMRSPDAQSVRHSRELVRRMTEDGRTAVNTTGVVFRSATLYAAQVTLPSDVPPGPYLAHTYVFKNGELIAERSEGFSVRKIGFERFIGQAATSQPLLYGVVSVVLALFTGWLGGVVFRR